jgi:hypothetical protein
VSGVVRIGTEGAVVAQAEVVHERLLLDGLDLLCFSSFSNDSFSFFCLYLEGNDNCPASARMSMCSNEFLSLVRFIW